MWNSCSEDVFVIESDNIAQQSYVDFQGKYASYESAITISFIFYGLHSMKPVAILLTTRKKILLFLEQILMQSKFVF